MDFDTTATGKVERLERSLQWLAKEAAVTGCPYPYPDERCERCSGIDPAKRKACWMKLAVSKGGE
jgi:hypothetical protein